jgi:hypothetical protein
MVKFSVSQSTKVYGGSVGVVLHIPWHYIESSALNPGHSLWRKEFPVHIEQAAVSTAKPVRVFWKTGKFAFPAGN